MGTTQPNELIVVVPNPCERSSAAPSRRPARGHSGRNEGLLRRAELNAFARTLEGEEDW